VVIDVSAYVGSYPFRDVPGGSGDALVRAMDRAGIDEAWVSHLAAVFWRDPMAGNPHLYREVSRSGRLRPVPAIHPGLPAWRAAFDEALRHEAPAIRCDPEHYGLDPQGREVGELLAACGLARIPLLVAIQFEDQRQRHPHDRAAPLAPWYVRSYVRRDPAVRLVVSGAGRGFIEEVHFGSTPAESERIWWDVAWIWGPPEDDLALLLDTLGPERFVFGTCQPLRLPEAVVAKLDMIDRPGRWREAVESGNATHLAAAY